MEDLDIVWISPDQDPSLTIFMLQMTSSCPDGSQEWATCVQKYIGNQINMNYPMYAIFWNLKVNQKKLFLFSRCRTIPPGCQRCDKHCNGNKRNKVASYYPQMISSLPSLHDIEQNEIR